MKKLLFVLSLIVTLSLSAQTTEHSCCKETSKNLEIKPKNWSLGVSAGYINIPVPNLGNNVWGSANIGYSKKNWSLTAWCGANYWVTGRQPDLRLGLTTSYTIFKW